MGVVAMTQNAHVQLWERVTTADDPRADVVLDYKTVQRLIDEYAAAGKAYVSPCPQCGSTEVWTTSSFDRVGDEVDVRRGTKCAVCHYEEVWKRIQP